MKLKKLIPFWPRSPHHDDAVVLRKFFADGARPKGARGKPASFLIKGEMLGNAEVDRFLGSVLGGDERFSFMDTRLIVFRAEDSDCLSSSALAHLRGSEGIIETVPDYGPQMDGLWRQVDVAVEGNTDSTMSCVFESCRGREAILNPEGESGAQFLQSWSRLGDTDDGQSLRAEIYGSWYGPPELSS